MNENTNDLRRDRYVLEVNWSYYKTVASCSVINNILRFVWNVVKEMFF